MSIAISGTVAPGYEPVANAFAKGFDGNPRMGAALHILRDGQPVVDLWAGQADARTGRAWGPDTPSVIYSCTKGLVSILAARLVQEGLLDFESPVARYWPEFAAAGKDRITVADALSHRAGLSATRADLTEADILDWDRITSVLAAQDPLWPPGTAYGYHAITHGWLAGEIIRRVTGLSVGTYFRQLIAGPLGVDAWIGLPADRMPDVTHQELDTALIDFWKVEAARPAPNWPYRAMTLGAALPVELVTQDGGFNAPQVLAAEIPGAGGVATARALATIWSATVVPTRGERLLSDEVIAMATATRSTGMPVFGGEPPFCRWGAGFQLDSDAFHFLADGSFGHGGAGGQVGFADRTTGIGFAYLTNWMMGPEDTRAAKIIDALRALVQQAAGQAVQAS